MKPTKNEVVLISTWISAAQVIYSSTVTDREGRETDNMQVIYRLTSLFVVCPMHHSVVYGEPSGTLLKLPQLSSWQKPREERGRPLLCSNGSLYILGWLGPRSTYLFTEEIINNATHHQCVPEYVISFMLPVNVIILPRLIRSICAQCGTMNYDTKVDLD